MLSELLIDYLLLDVKLVNSFSGRSETTEISMLSYFSGMDFKLVSTL